MTRAELITEARFLAREHARETDSLTGSEWVGCLRRAWVRMWTRYPQAFHVGGQLVGAMPEAPATDAASVALLPEWVGVLAAAVAAAAVGSRRPQSDDEAKVISQQVETLESVFAAGVGA
jgi:hypothetical protein